MLSMCVYDVQSHACTKCGVLFGNVVASRNCTASSSVLCGTALKDLLKDWLNIEATPACSCNAMARTMDLLGPDWCCGEGMPQIIGVMREEHAKRWADGRTILPWTDAGARQLVLLACRRAKAKAS